ncbi:MAG: tetratricopeptide repeat protein [Geminicoccaceae bacterium]
MATSADAARSRSLTVDLAWERCQEQALQAFRTGDATSARTNWAKALEIAERHFERGDPRIATSFSNHAFALVRRESIHQANNYFQRAMIAWEESWCWIPWMAPSTKPDEVEAAPYDRETQEGFYALIRRGQAITETLWRENRLSETEGDDWSKVKPNAMTDIRRLFSAVFLMPTARDRGMAARRRHHAA